VDHINDALSALQERVAHKFAHADSCVSHFGCVLLYSVYELDKGRK
jgi:hypothetical protein